MPIIARFLGMTVKMFFREKEHNPPHIHTYSGEHMGVFELQEGFMIEGDLNQKEQRVIKRFITYYKTVLNEMWESQEFHMLEPIE